MLVPFFKIRKSTYFPFGDAPLRAAVKCETFTVNVRSFPEPLVVAIPTGVAVPLISIVIVDTFEVLEKPQ